MDHCWIVVIKAGKEQPQEIRNYNKKKSTVKYPDGLKDINDRMYFIFKHETFICKLVFALKFSSLDRLLCATTSSTEDANSILLEIIHK